jgi:DNA-binding transcriptional LysR family regulator
MPAFSAEHPNVVVELGLNDRRVDLIEEGWDMTVRIGTLDENSLVARKIADASMVLCAAPAYWHKHGKPSQAAEPSQHNCLRYSLSSHAYRNVWAFGRQREILVPVSGNLRANNGDALVNAAVEGQGVICEPEFVVADAVGAGKLEVAVVEEPFGQLGGIHIVYPPQRHLPKRLRAMIDFLATRFGPVPPWRL